MLDLRFSFLIKPPPVLYSPSSVFFGVLELSLPLGRSFGLHSPLQSVSGILLFVLAFPPKDGGHTLYVQVREPTQS